MKFVVMGVGYVGMALLNYFQSQPYEISITTTKEARVEELQPYGKHVLLLHPTDNSALKELIDNSDGIIILVAPKNANSYEETYLKTAQRVSAILNERKTPFYILYTSSTSVCEGIQNDWVIENSVLHPKSENSRILLETEQCYLNCQASVCVLRLGGIYGPNRELIHRAMRFSGKEMSGTGNETTNHIHLEDIIKAIVFCIKHSLTGLYHLVNDDHPSRKELYSSLCHILDIPLPIWNSYFPTTQEGYKISNQKIKDAGFIFTHPYLL